MVFIGTPASFKKFLISSRDSDPTFFTSIAVNNCAAFIRENNFPFSTVPAMNSSKRTCPSPYTSSESTTCEIKSFPPPPGISFSTPKNSSSRSSNPDPSTSSSLNSRSIAFVSSAPRFCTSSGPNALRIAFRSWNFFSPPSTAGVIAAFGAEPPSRTHGWASISAAEGRAAGSQVSMRETAEWASGERKGQGSEAKSTSRLRILSMSWSSSSW
mmetsp:Transcript_21045/g.56159  ORF Transcript_21045/g.56159 Transcript_21045/m.56159 type:complete len:213 (+) Transcript_21045:151-789(+)